MSDENNAEHEVSNIMKELQPIAFLFSVCMVVAAFYTNNEVNKTDLANVLMASLFFFFAYIGLFFSKKTDFRWFMYFGEFSLAIGAIYVYKSLVGIAKIIDQAAIDTNSLWIYIVLYSFFLILFMYLSNKVKNEGIYFCKLFFHISLILFCFYVILLLWERRGSRIP
ncbi:hypothetical protein [Methanosarcina barkeri]|uniref:Uncharacterized protein n=1 Tax=Methanosarcina barkeri (strain Fusaro / DSM 804) TaxID=269797 RepID=Q46FB4_METBF|nr:hypothetical protein [Methanosarcina barkeri]